MFRHLSPPTKEKDLVRKWMACIFEHRFPHLYVGWILKHFLNNEAGLVVRIELDCLEQKLGSSDGILPQGTSDIDVFPVKNNIVGPLQMIPIKGQRWEYPKYESLVKLVVNVQKISRNILYDKYVCKNAVSYE